MTPKTLLHRSFPFTLLRAVLTIVMPLAMATLSTGQVATQQRPSSRLWFVPDDSLTIQGAIDNAGNGDGIIVRPGAYQESIYFRGKAIVLMSEQGPSVTSIEPPSGQGGSVVTFQDGEGPQTILSGFTIKNGTGTLLAAPWNTSYGGGGILCVSQSSPTIRGNVIRDNVVASASGLWGGNYGGGICAHFSSPRIVGNIIENNSVLTTAYRGPAQGGGIWLYESSSEIRNNTITGNLAGSLDPTSNRAVANFGGGIGAQGDASLYLTIADNIIDNNQCFGQGGGLHVQGYGSGCSIIDNTISNNSTDNEWSLLNGRFWASGGGASISSSTDGTRVLFRGNTFTLNTCVGSGGGVACGSADFIDNTFVGNVAQSFLADYSGGFSWGGAVYVAGGTWMVFQNNRLINNTAYHGGGLFGTKMDGALITNNLLAGNSADTTGMGMGGGMYFQSEWTAIQEFSHNTFQGNSASDGGAFLCSNLLPMTATNCIFWGDSASSANPEISVANQPVTLVHCDYDGGWTGAGYGNINADPMFVSDGSHDYHLSQIPPQMTNQSPCVDTGDPASPVVVGTTRTDHVQDAYPVDMGYHYPIQ